MLNWLFLTTGYISQMVYLICWDVLVFFIIFPEKSVSHYLILKFQLYKEQLYLQTHLSFQIWEKSSVNL